MFLLNNGFGRSKRHPSHFSRWHDLCTMCTRLMQAQANYISIFTRANPKTTSTHLQPQQFFLASFHPTHIFSPILNFDIYIAGKDTKSTQNNIQRKDLQRRCSGIPDRSHLTTYLQNSVKYSSLYRSYRGDSLQCIIWVSQLGQA